MIVKLSLKDPDAATESVMRAVSEYARSDDEGDAVAEQAWAAIEKFISDGHTDIEIDTESGEARIVPVRR